MNVINNINSFFRLSIPITFAVGFQNYQVYEYAKDRRKIHIGQAVV